MKTKNLFTKAKNGVKDAAVSIITSHCEWTHFALEMAKQKVERIEANVKLKAYGEDTEATIQMRNVETIRKKLVIQEEYKNLKEKISEWTNFTSSEVDEVMQQTHTL